MKRAPQLNSAELLQRGLSQFRLGETDKAARTAETVLALEPRNLGALTLLGSIAMQEKRYELAASLLARATALAPTLGMLHSNHGEALRRLGRQQEALSAFRLAVQHSPELPETHYNLALVLAQLGLPGEASVEYEAALAFRPDFAAAACGFLNALRAAGELGRAISWYRTHAAGLADSAELRCAVAGSLLDSFRIDEAIVHLDRAIQLEPTQARAYSELGAALAERGEIEAALASMRRAVELEPTHAGYHGNLVYLTAFAPTSSAGALLEAARAYSDRHAPASLRMPPPPTLADHARRLRVGYVSADFREHPAARFLVPLFREHDRERVAVVAYSGVRQADHVTAQLRGLADEWRDIAGLDDQEAAELVRRDQIDVLVDLSQHSASNRLLMFARKPAPVQLSWLGYPGPSGVDAIDYRLTDVGLDPPEGVASGGERLLWLKGPYWSSEPPANAPDVTALPALQNGYVTFGCLNSFKKVSDVALELWARVLAAVPQSRLVLIAPEGIARGRVLRLFAEQGIEASRIELVSPLPRREYFATYGRIDVAFDPVPYCGGTTTLDALWMGVPVVTLAGNSAVSRSGAALAHWLDWGCQPATSSEDYVRCAVTLAGDLAQLSELRRSLRARLQQSPLADVRGFARAMESAFQEAWRSEHRLRAS